MGAQPDTAPNDQRDARPAAPDPAYAFDLFVSHAVADAEFVRGYLVPALNLPASRVLLLDELPATAAVVAELDRGVSRSRFTVAVLSPAYLADRWAVQGEQLASYLSSDEARVIPLRLADCKLPLHLDARVALDFRDRAGWDLAAKRLRDLLHSAEPVAEQLACPYPGMHAFTTAEAKQFFGRDAEIADLIGRLDRGEREIYVIGPSGSGKSSLIQAGLLPALDAGTSPLGRKLVVQAIRPGERPSDRLAKALEGDLAAPAAAIAALVARHPPAERVLVFIDQLEELFTLAEPAERQRFIQAVVALRAEPRCQLVIALRADFYGALMDSALWPAPAGVSRLEVAPLRGAALANAITAPALRVGVYLEARLCDRLVGDAAEEPGALPLLQETLRLLWDKRRRRLLELAAYEALGNGGRGLYVAIAQHADAALAALPAGEQAIARRVLLRLVSFGEGRIDTRRQQEVQALRSAADDAGGFARVLQRLVEDRLITVGDAAADHDALADLSHEALITAWPALHDWIARRRVDEQQRRRLDAKVAEWVARGRGTARLLDPVELAEAARWIASDAARELGYGADLSALVAASRAELARAERQRRQRTLRAIGTLAGFLVVASVLGLVAWHQRGAARDQAQIAKDRADEAQRQTREVQRLLGMTYQERGRVLLLDGHPMQALPFFVEARAQHLESPVLRMLFAQASRDLPLISWRGHAASANVAAFSADGTRIVTASTDHTARVWDAATGAPVTPPLPHRGTVYAAAFSPDGTRVVTASEDGTARVWDAATGAPVTAPLPHNDAVTMAGFSPDGKRVATASLDGTARVWNAATGQPITGPLEHQNAVITAVFSPDGTRILTASNDHTARIWDAATGRPIGAALAHDDAVHAAVFSPDGTRVLTVCEDGMVRIWSVATRGQVVAPLAHDNLITRAQFSPDGARVVTACLDGTVGVWDATTGKRAFPALGHRGPVNAAVFSPDGTRIATASEDGTARVWSAVTGASLAGPFEHRGLVNTAGFSPDGKRVVTGSVEGMVEVWDTTAESMTAVPFADPGGVWPAAFSPDGGRVVTGSSHYTARVWNAATGAPVTSPVAHLALVRDAAFSPDGTRVVTASMDYGAEIWDAATAALVAGPLIHPGPVRSAAFSPDGTRVVTICNDSFARVWDARTGAQVAALDHPGRASAAVFTPNGARLVTAGEEGQVRVWDTTAWTQVIAPLAHADGIDLVAFSPDGTRMVAAGGRQVEVWSTATWTSLQLPAFPGTLSAASFSADGTRIVTAGRDGTARIWDAARGTAVTEPLVHPPNIYAAAFSPDGTRLVTASSNQTAQIWDAATGKPVAAPIPHPDAVQGVAWSPDGRQLLMASGAAVSLWTLATAPGSLADWQARARCAPFAVVDNVVVPSKLAASACVSDAAIADPPATR